MSKPEQHVSLVAGPNCETESFAIRSALEYFGTRVTLHLIGRPNDLVDVLRGDDLDEKVDYLILNFHGDEGRFCMPELGEDVYEEDEPRGEFFTAEDVKRCAKLQDTRIIASGCTLGIEELANAFLACGCQSYIAPDDYIDGNANLMFVLRFMYELIQHKKSEQEAFELARSIDEETSMYKRYVR